MQPLYNHLLVKVARLHDDEVRVGNLSLVQDTSYDEERYRTTRVEVLASPLGLRSDSYLPQTKGCPRYSYDTLQDIPSAGDYAYVKWSALESTMEIEPGVYSVDLSQVVALPDGCGGFIGFGGYVLCLPIFPETEKEGAATGTMTASGLLLVENVKPTVTEGDESNIRADLPTQDDVLATKYEGMVRYTGPVLKGQQDEVKAFDHVIFSKEVCTRDGYPLKLKLEGREYFCVRRDAIAGIRATPRPTHQLNAAHLVVEADNQKLAA